MQSRWRVVSKMFSRGFNTKRLRPRHVSTPQARNDRWAEEWVRRRGARKHVSYWVERPVGGLKMVYPGPRGAPPQRHGDAHFYVNGERAFRHVGHPDGPSSVPYFWIRRGHVYAGEGYPSGPSDNALYRIEAWKPEPRGIRVRRIQRPRSDED